MDQHAPRSIILLSEKRSGSTILQYEFARHPQVQLIEHTEHNDHETLYWLKAACLLGFPKEDFLHGQPPYDRLTARNKLVELICSNVPDFVVPVDDEQLIFDGWTALCWRFRPVWFEKSPHHPQHWAALSALARYIQSTDLEVRIIGLVRNPLGMLYSAWSSWNSEPSQRQFAWLSSYQNLIRFQEIVSPTPFLMVRYEDLVAQPTSSMNELYGFAGLPYEDLSGSDIHSKSVEKWTTDPLYTLQLDPKVQALAKTFGYQDQDLNNPRKPVHRFSILQRAQSVWGRRNRVIAAWSNSQSYRILRPLIRAMLKVSFIRRLSNSLGLTPRKRAVR